MKQEITIEEGYHISLIFLCVLKNPWQSHEFFSLMVPRLGFDISCVQHELNQRGAA